MLYSFRNQKQYYFSSLFRFLLSCATDFRVRGHLITITKGTFSYSGRSPVLRRASCPVSVLSVISNGSIRRTATCIGARRLREVSHLPFLLLSRLRKVAVSVRLTVKQVQVNEYSTDQLIVKLLLSFCYLFDSFLLSTIEIYLFSNGLEI